LITDAIRHKAWDAFTNCKGEFISDKLKAVLEAIEPDLRIAAYLEVADLCYEFENISGCPKLITQRDILDHAQELDPK
jgi:hypothetical protein